MEKRTVITQTRDNNMGESLYNIWSKSNKVKAEWVTNGWKWIYQPFWYCKKDDDENKGARCAKCNTFVERKTQHSLEAHELTHWD